MSDPNTVLICNDGDFFDHIVPEHFKSIVSAVKKRIPDGIVKIFAKVADKGFYSFSCVIFFLDNDDKLYFSIYENRPFLYYVKANAKNMDNLKRLANIGPKDVECVNKLNEIILSFNDNPLVQEFYTSYEPFNQIFFTGNEGDFKFAEPANAVSNARNIRFKSLVRHNEHVIPFSLGANYNCHSCISKNGEIYQFYIMSIGNHYFCIDTLNMELKVISSIKEINEAYLEDISGFKSFKPRMIDDILFQSFSIHAKNIPDISFDGVKSSDYSSIRDLMNLVSMLTI
jgi:hypothetical protein